MGEGKSRGTAVSLVIASHPLQAVLVALGCAVVALLAGRTWAEVGIVLATVLVGRVTVGWLDDLVDRERDRRVDRGDRPVAQGWLHPSTVAFSIACATCLLVPLSVSLGPTAGIAHLFSVAVAWVGTSRIKATVLSWFPWALSFGLLPAYLAYASLDPAGRDSPPTPAMTLLFAALGVCLHFLDSLPQLVGDNENGVKHLPLRVALRLGAPRLLLITTVVTGAVLLGLAVAGFTVGLER